MIWHARNALLLLPAIALAAQGMGASAGPAPSADRISLSAGGTTLDFGTSGGRVSLTRLCRRGGENLIIEQGTGGPLWRVSFAGPNGAAMDVSSNDAAFINARATSDRAAVRWKAKLGDGAADVEVTVRSAPGDQLTRWNLQAALPDGWKVARCDFPMVPGIRISRGLKMAWPAGWGLEFDVRPGFGYSATYPSAAAGMQFVAFYGGDRGLYIGAHDPKGGHKYFDAKADNDAVAFTCTNWVGVSEKSGGTYKVPYDAVIGAFSGDYYDAARIYREFTYKAVWGKAGPVSSRPIPQWLKDTDLWIMPDAQPVDNVEACRKAVDLFGVPISAHWYNWHEIPFDTLYPDYFPAKPRFAEGVRELQKLGMHVMPYINGRLADGDSRMWKERRLDQSAAKQENGDVYTEVYGSGVKLHPMCPLTPTWQDAVEGIVKQLTVDCGVDSVYIDQIGAAGAVRCFDSSHGHPLGGGTMWVDGYRKMLDRIRRDLPKGKMLTTEENAECWIDQLDALLMVNTPTMQARLIPLFPAVYSGRTITFGFQYIVGDDISKSFPFRAKMARAFIWGSQLGWVSVGSLLAPEASKEAEFLRNLARCRQRGHQFLACGTYLGEPRITLPGNPPRIRGEAAGSFGGTYPIDLPSMIGSLWQAEDGSLGIALANVSDASQEASVELPLARVGIDPSAAGMDVKILGPDGLISSAKSRSRSQSVRVPARSAVIISVSKGM